MKKTTYLIVAMLMAFTMVGCQVDLSDYLTKEEAANTYATKSYVDGKVAELETKISDIDAKFANYYTKGEVDEKLAGYATKEDLAALGDISKAVKEYLDTVNWEDYIGDGYTNAEIDEKINAIKEVTDKLGDVETLLADVTNLKTSVTSLESTVAELKTTGLSTEQLESIKTTIKSEISGDITTVKNEILADAVTTDGLKEYIKDVFGFTDYDIEVMIDWNKYNSMDYFTFRISDLCSGVSALHSRIEKVETLLTVDGVLGKKLTNLENTINGKADASLKDTVDTIKSWYEANKDKVTNLNLADYLTVANAENTYATKSRVETVASNLADLTSRVETLETILEIEKKENETISKLKVDYLALKSTVETLATSEALTELSGTIETLKKSVADNKTYLEGKIADSDTNISAIRTKVANLESAQATFNTFVETTTSAIATINGTLSNKANASDVKNETQIKELVANAITENTTLVTKEYLEAQNYLTSGSYATTEKVNELETTVNEAKTYIESINSKYASLVSDRTSFELYPNCFANNGVTGRPTYFYYPYIKFTYADGKVEYMVFGYDGQDPMYTWADTRVRGRYPYIIPDMENDLSFKDLFSTYNESGELRRYKRLSNLVILFVDSISSDYLPETNN
ncbi:MAG: hypothetical protein MJ182_10335 [Treponema sp.]|nr:hypothetical protein [Treponema sp.]